MVIALREVHQERDEVEQFRVAGIVQPAEHECALDKQ